MLLCDYYNNFVFINALKYTIYAYCIFSFFRLKDKKPKKQKQKKTTFEFEKIMVFSTSAHNKTVIIASLYPPSLQEHYIRCLPYYILFLKTESGIVSY